ncbi:hypothetical protein AKJ16_DCAP15567 [Drosera capensis]
MDSFSKASENCHQNPSSSDELAACNSELQDSKTKMADTKEYQKLVVFSPMDDQFSDELASCDSKLQDSKTKMAGCKEYHKLGNDAVKNGN